MYDTIEQKLNVAIKYNEVIKFLEGLGLYKIDSDPRDINSPHAYNACIECYNKCALKNKNLKQIFENEIISKLKNEKCTFYDVYCIFNCLLSQIRLENKNIASFKIDENKLMEILILLKEKTNYYKDYLSRCQYEKGYDYSDGMYGYMNKESERVYNETGTKIL